MNTVCYRTTTRVDCPCDAEVFVCIDSALTSNGAPFIPATLTRTTTTIDACNNTIYTYYIEYCEDCLADPQYSLVNSDINGIICRGCLTDFIEYLASHGGYDEEC